MPAKKDDALKVIDVIRMSKMAKVKSIEIEFEDDEEDMTSVHKKLAKNIEKKRKGKS